MNIVNVLEGMHADITKAVVDYKDGIITYRINRRGKPFGLLMRLKKMISKLELIVTELEKDQMRQGEKKDVI